MADKLDGWLVGGIIQRSFWARGPDYIARITEAQDGQLYNVVLHTRLES
jgi:hypothetical protein